MTLLLKLRLSYFLTLASYAVLLLALSASLLWDRPVNSPANAVIWAVVVLPLLAFLPGLLKARFRTCIWLCFVLLLYFLQLTLVLWGDRAGWSDWLAMAALVLLYVAAMFFARWQQQALRAAAEEALQSAAPDSTGPA